MATPNINGKEIANTVYHAVVVSALAAGYSRLTKLIFTKAPTPRLAFNLEDIGMVTLDIALAMATKDMLEKQGILPHDILK